MHWPVFHYSQPSTQLTIDDFTHISKAGQRILVTSLLASLLLHDLRTCLVHGLDAGGHGKVSTPPEATVAVNLGQLQQIHFAHSLPIRFTPFLRYLQALLTSIPCQALSRGVPRSGVTDSLSSTTSRWQQLARQPPKHRHYRHHTETGRPWGSELPLQHPQHSGAPSWHCSFTLYFLTLLA